MVVRRHGHASRTKIATGIDGKKCNFDELSSRLRHRADIQPFLDFRETAAKVVRGTTRLARTRASRRNTMDCALLNEIFIDDDPKKSDKRTIQLLRESERDMKRASGIIYPTATGLATPINGSPSKNNACAASKAGAGDNRDSVFTFEERSESSPVGRLCMSNNLAVVPKLIESCNRYMSVASRPIGCRSSAPPLAFVQKESILPVAVSLKASQVNAATAAASQNEKAMLQTRQDFHETFANLIKLGSSDKQESKLSNEDYTWQTELKDMIWLELQAWHADRTLEQQDKYLYTARQEIPNLLQKILNYK